MLASALSVRALLVAIFILMAGSGFLSTLLAVRLEDAGVASLVIGLVATSYFSGLMLGSLRVLWPWPGGTETTDLAAPSGDVGVPVMLAVIGCGVVIVVELVATRHQRAD